MTCEFPNFHFQMQIHKERKSKRGKARVLKELSPYKWLKRGRGEERGGEGRQLQYVLYDSILLLHLDSVLRDRLL